ncbi:MAG: aminotransferase class III-fold pyridoxal phosphate-dependent enzyme, partial [Methyloprofundus sp.]|nr:aminotransferase class III-fold pyridoxal phosphate-dependent enzyme [Methyloprofundus sp.]
KGSAINQAFSERLKNNTHVIDVRNKGMMVGIELDKPCTELVALAVSAGLLINVAGEKNIRLLPPLIINNEQIELLVDTLSSLIDSYTK